MRVRYRRVYHLSQDRRVRDYLVRTQDKPRGRWAVRGLVSGFGPGPRPWMALGDGAAAWTRYRATRAAAVADMLAGRTWPGEDDEDEHGERGAK
jgi:hypothetical protein